MASTTTLDAISRAFYARGLGQSGVAQHAQSTFIAAACRAYDYIPMRAPAAPTPLRCAYCATYFVPAGRSCGCGANREDVAHALRVAQRRLADSMMNVYSRR